MELSLNGKRALVCGGSKGIGKAAAIELASLGATVTLFARQGAALARVARTELPAIDGQAHDYLTADFQDTRVVEQMVADAVGGGRTFHVLVNNTGGPPPGRLIDAGADDLERAFRMHVLAAQAITGVVAPGMEAAGFGRIINVISTSVKAPIPGLGVSNTVRGAMASWAKTLAGELGPSGVTVNNVLPGFTDTERLGALLEGRAEREGKTLSDVQQSIKATIPARRFATPDEVGAAVAFLATPAAAYINGINLPVDGGRTPSL